MGYLLPNFEGIFLPRTRTEVYLHIISTPAAVQFNAAVHGTVGVEPALGRHSAGDPVPMAYIPSGEGQAQSIKEHGHRRSRPDPGERVRVAVTASGAACRTSKPGLGLGLRIK